MQMEVGKIVEGKVVKIAKFGAFIELEPKVNGLVHISEISKQFIVNVSDFLSVGDKVKVKILNSENGKISLSIKQAQDLPLKHHSNNKLSQQANEPSNKSPIIFKQAETSTNLSFEEMLSKFKKNSEEKLSDIKRNSENRRSSYSRRR